MKNNGVVNIKPDDKELWKSLEKFKNIEKKTIESNIDKYKLEYYAEVKVVAHCPSGNRSIGTLYRTNDDQFILIMLGFSNYNRQLF